MLTQAFGKQVVYGRLPCYVLKEADWDDAVLKWQKKNKFRFYVPGEEIDE